MGLFSRLSNLMMMLIAEGAVTAPKTIRDLVGPCGHCNSRISTHAYELLLESADCVEPTFSDKYFDSVVLCPLS